MNPIRYQKAIARLQFLIWQHRESYAKYVSALLKAVRYINALKIKKMADFGEGLHSAHSEPYFYDSAYLFVKRPDILTIDQSGICRQEENVSE